MTPVVANAINSAVLGRIESRISDTEVPVFVEVRPNQPQRPRKDLGTLPQPDPQACAREPSALLDLQWIQCDLLVRLAAKDPHELPPGACTCFKPEDRDRRFGGPQPEFLLELPDGTCEVAFPAPQVARGRGIPEARGALLVKRPPLQEESAFGVEDQNVRGAVAQAESMHVTPAHASDDPVVLVDGIQDFIAHNYRSRTHTAVSLCSDFTPEGRDQPPSLVWLQDPRCGAVNPQRLQGVLAAMKKRHGVSGRGPGRVPLRAVPCIPRISPVSRQDADGGQARIRRDCPQEERRQLATRIEEERVGAVQRAIHNGDYLPRPYHIAKRLMRFAARLPTRDDDAVPSAPGAKPRPCPSAALLDWMDHVLDGKH